MGSEKKPMIYLLLVVFGVLFLFFVFFLHSDAVGNLSGNPFLPLLSAISQSKSCTQASILQKHGL